MNIMKLIIPKSMTSFIDEDCTLRQALEKMKHHGFTAIPVLNGEGEYVGTLSEGDFLWSMAERDDFTMKGQENIRLSGILKKDTVPPLRIDAGMAQIVIDLMDRNFAPVVDDRNKFVGIVTRRDVLRFLSEEYFKVGEGGKSSG